MKMKLVSAKETQFTFGLESLNQLLKLFRIGLFRAAHGCWEERPLFLKSIIHKVQETYESCDTLNEFC